jgi:hypothetical protein
MLAMALSPGWFIPELAYLRPLREGFRVAASPGYAAQNK